MRQHPKTAASLQKCQSCYGIKMLHHTRPLTCLAATRRRRDMNKGKWGEIRKTVAESDRSDPLDYRLAYII